MERLQASLDQVFLQLTQSLSRPNRLRVLVKDAGGSLNKAECADIMAKACNEFIIKGSKKVKELVEECEVPSKLDELAKLTAESEEANKENGLTGYRSLDPVTDITADIRSVQQPYIELLTGELEAVDEEIAEQKALLAKRLAEVEKVAARLERKLADTANQ